MTQLRSVTCRMGSHSVTCHSAQVNVPRLNPSHAGRYSIYLPRGMEGWVDLVDFIAPRPGVEPATFWSRVRRSTVATTKTRWYTDTVTEFIKHHVDVVCSSQSRRVSEFAKTSRAGASSHKQMGTGSLFLNFQVKCRFLYIFIRRKTTTGQKLGPQGQGGLRSKMWRGLKI